MLNIIKKQKIAQATEKLIKSRPYAHYKENPASKNSAAIYAAYCAKRDNKDYVVYAGNSYGCFVWRIASLEKMSLTECNNMQFAGLIVTPSLEVFDAEQSG